MSMKAWGHFRTITKHKNLVMYYCFRAGLYRQGLLHDLSKYAPAEQEKAVVCPSPYYEGSGSPAPDPCGPWGGQTSVVCPEPVSAQAGCAILTKKEKELQSER